MNYIFNDAILSKKEINQEINRVFLMVINDKNQFLIKNDFKKMSIAYVDEPSPLIDELKEKGILNTSEPLVTIEDYQYRYPLNSLLHPNILLHGKCYVIHSNDILVEGCNFLDLFEINQHIDKYYKEDDCYQYDDRILKILMENYVKDHTSIFYDPEYYRNYLIDHYLDSKDNISTARKIRAKYIDMFYGKELLTTICNDSREYISNLIYNIDIRNKEYASASFSWVKGLYSCAIMDDWYADIIATYEDENHNERFLSTFILKNVLGYNYKIYLTNEYDEVKDDNGNVIGEFVGQPELMIKGNVDNLLDIAIRENNNKALVKKKDNK